MKCLILIVMYLFCVKKVLTLDCYWNTECKYKYFSSKTPYENIRGDIRDSIVKPQGCEAVSLWAIIRHGKRNPSQKFGQSMSQIIPFKDFMVSSYEIGNSSLCAQDIENIKKWKIKTDILESPNKISSEGYEEVLRIGSRIKDTFPELLNDLQEKDYLFLPGFGNRLSDSAKAFLEGLNHSDWAITYDSTLYRIVAPYSICGKYQVEVRQNPNVYSEEEEYKKTDDYLNMKERVEKKLGLNFTLSNEKFTAMYDLCRYTWNGFTNTPSPWCAVFSVKDLQVLEYIDDLRHYYRNSYGVPQFSKTLGQMPLADLLRTFEQMKKGKGKKIVSYFTHATMMDMILVVLNLYKDVNPLVGAYRDINRKWRTSFLSTFASNMIAVLYRCSQHERNDYDYKVAFYWNEKPLLDLCNNGICSWQEFEDIFKPFLNATTDFCEFEWTPID